jgi:murein L,D-transpeptidase YafK
MMKKQILSFCLGIYLSVVPIYNPAETQKTIVPSTAHYNPQYVTSVISSSVSNFDLSKGFAEIYTLIERKLRDFSSGNDLSEGQSLESLVAEYDIAQGHKLVIEKSRRRLAVYGFSNKFDQEILLKEYPIVLGLHPEGDKEVMGDRKTPEGEFYIAQKNPHSQFYKSLLLNYPNLEDISRGLRDGLITKSEAARLTRANQNCQSVPSNTRLGGIIEIHGKRFGSRDWTFGCVSLSDEDTDEVYRFAYSGCRKGQPRTKVIINP